MKKEAKETLMTAIMGTKEISHLCIEMGFDLKRLMEFVEDEKSTKIIEKLMEKMGKIPEYCISITAICKTVADGKSGIKSVEETMDKMVLNGEIKTINWEDKT